MNEEWEELAIKRATLYMDMRDMSPQSGMYREVMHQYKDMARGGDGGPLGFTPEDWRETCVERYLPVTTEPTCRSYNYPTHPDSFFRKVLKILGEDHVG